MVTNDVEMILRLRHYFGGPDSMQRDHVENLCAEVVQLRARLERVQAVLRQDSITAGQIRAALDAPLSEREVTR